MSADETQPATPIAANMLQPETDDGPDEARRDALRRLGLYGAYTAPAMIAILVANKAVAQTTIECNPTCEIFIPG